MEGTVTVGQNLNSQSYQTRQTLGPASSRLSRSTWPTPPASCRRTTSQTIRLESYFAQATRRPLRPALPDRGDPERRRFQLRLDHRRNWFPKGSAAWTFFRGAEGENRLADLRQAARGIRPERHPAGSRTCSQRAARRRDHRWRLGPGVFDPAERRRAASSPGTTCRPTQLGPERVKEFETGFDLGLFQDKADFGVTYYRQNSTDVILNIPVAGSTGYTEKPANAASLRNIGVEMALNVRPITTRIFAWDIGLPVGQNRSRVTDLAGVQFAPFPLSGGTNGLGIQGVAVKGQPLGVYYGTDYVRCGRGLTVRQHRHRQHGRGVPGRAGGALYIDTTGYPQLDAAGSLRARRSQPGGPVRYVPRSG